VRLLGLTTFYAAALGGYLGTGAWSAGRAHVLSASPLDRALPADARFAPLYLSFFPLLLALLLVLARRPGFARRLGVAAGLLASSLLVFVLWPTRVERPVLDPQGLAGALARWIQRVDPASNALPSLHGSLTVLASALAVRERIVPAWLAWGACALVLYSALALRQHLFLDLGAGALLGGLAARLDRALEERTT
jgi:membrane-associated phospholipid phosphatase